MEYVIILIIVLVLLGLIIRIFEAIGSALGGMLKGLGSLVSWVWAATIRILIIAAIVEVISFISTKIGILYLAKKNKISSKKVVEYFKSECYSSKNKHGLYSIVPFRGLREIIKLYNKTDIIKYYETVNIEKIRKVIPLDRLSKLAECRGILDTLESDKYLSISQMVNGGTYENVYYNVLEVLVNLCGNYDINNSMDEINHIIDETHKSFCEFRDIIVGMEKENQDQELSKIKDAVCGNLDKLQTFNKALK